MAKKLLYLVFLLVGLAAVIPYFAKARWVVEGVPFTFVLAVTDATTGAPVPGARANISIGPAVFDDLYTGTTDDAGLCQLGTYFPGSGSGQRGRLTIGSMKIVVKAVGYQTWEKPCVSFLGETYEIDTGPSKTNFYPLRVVLRPQILPDVVERH